MIGFTSMHSFCFCCCCCWSQAIFALLSFFPPSPSPPLALLRVWEKPNRKENANKPTPPPIIHGIVRAAHHFLTHTCILPDRPMVRNGQECMCGEKERETPIKVSARAQVSDSSVQASFLHRGHQARWHTTRSSIGVSVGFIHSCGTQSQCMAYTVCGGKDGSCATTTTTTAWGKHKNASWATIS